MTTSQDEIRVAVVGLGPRALKWIALLMSIEGFRITAIHDRVPALSPRALTAIGSEDVRVHGSYESVLDDSHVDAIALVVRDEHQGAMAAQAIEAGKHVHAEVPAAHSIEDCWRLVLAVERGTSTYLLGEQTRYWGFIDAWRDMVARGQLGHPTFVEGQYFHYYTAGAYQDPETGQLRSPQQAAATDRPSIPTWGQIHPPIHYLPHELSPMLKVLDDRVNTVTGMSTRAPSYGPDGLQKPDMQVALMKTEKDTILRMAVSSVQPHPETNYHWYQVTGTLGRVEWKRADRGLPLMWLYDHQMHDLATVDWRQERTDAPAGAMASLHGGADYYPHIDFRDAVREGRQPEFDVYRAVETAAPAILAAESIAQGSTPFTVPNFRPGPHRPAGEAPGGSQPGVDIG